MLHDGRYPFVKLIEEWEIRNGDLAKIANVPQPRVSDYASGKPVSDLVARRIEQAVRDIVRVYTALAPIRIVLDPESFPNAVVVANIMNARRAESAPDVLQDLLDLQMPELIG